MRSVRHGPTRPNAVHLTLSLSPMSQEKCAMALTHKRLNEPYCDPSGHLLRHLLVAMARTIPRTSRGRAMMGTRRGPSQLTCDLLYLCSTRLDVDSLAHVVRGH